MLHQPDIKHTQPAHGHAEATAAYPSHAEQSRILRAAFAETTTMADPALHRAGPLIKGLQRQLETVETDLRSIHPEAQPSILMSDSYWSMDDREFMGELDEDRRQAVYQLRQSRGTRLREHAQDNIVPVLQVQGIGRAVLSTPPFAYQGEGMKKPFKYQLCMNACYRMICGALTGWIPDEDTFTDAVVEHHGTPLVADDVYRKLLVSRAFGKACGKSIAIIDIKGADFTTVASVATRARQRRPDASVHCITSISSDRMLDLTWHSTVLLGVDDETVMVHEPKYDESRAYKRMDKEVFASRWGMALNRAQLIIAD